MYIMKEYDYVIIGGGPTGLAAATALSPFYKIALVEREHVLGGCHRVRRDAKGYFGEHGPRVYPGSYATVNSLLEHIGLSWDQVFTKTQYSPDLVDGKHWYSMLSTKEIFALLTACIPYFLWNPSYGSEESVLHFCQRHNFSEGSIRYMDRICRFSDGASASRYPLHKFLSGFNEHIMYNFYRQRIASDVFLFKQWASFLRDKRSVHMYLGERSVTLEGRGSVVKLGEGEPLHASKGVVLAIPPENAVKLLNDSRLDVPPGFAKFAHGTEYEEYLNVTYHFSSPLPPSFPYHKYTPWSIAYLPQLDDTVLSTSATLLSIPSPRTGKTAHQCTRKELAEEIMNQLRQATGYALEPTRVVVSSGLKRHGGKWDDEDTAFVKTPDSPFWYNFSLLPGVYTVGTHTGRSTDNFTSMESAVQNGLALAHHLHPELHHVLLAPRWSLTVRHIILAMMSLCIMYGLARKIL